MTVEFICVTGLGVTGAYIENVSWQFALRGEKYSCFHYFNYGKADKFILMQKL